jgi:hypothetical protein
MRAILPYCAVVSYDHRESDSSIPKADLVVLEVHLVTQAILLSWGCPTSYQLCSPVGEDFQALDPGRSFRTPETSGVFEPFYGIVAC